MILLVLENSSTVKIPRDAIIQFIVLLMRKLRKN